MPLNKAYIKFIQSNDKQIIIENFPTNELDK